MRGYVTDIEQQALDNNLFRKVLYTATYTQLVVMCIPPGKEIGQEIHGQDQFIRIEAGEGTTYIGDAEHALQDGKAVIIPAGTRHNVVNTGTTMLKLYTLYSPPHHKDGTEHRTKEDADADEEEFLGDTSE